MSKLKKIPELKGRDFNGIPYPKIKHIRQEFLHKSGSSGVPLFR